MLVYKKELLKIFLLLNVLMINLGDVFATEISEEPSSNIHFDSYSYYAQSASFDRNDRLSFALGGSFGVIKYFRVDSQILYAWDQSRAQATEVKISENHTVMNLLATATFPYFFRFGLGMGPSLIYTSSKTRFAGAERNHSLFQWGLSTVLTLEYAFTPRWEFRGIFAQQGRPYDKKTDYYLGAGISYVIFSGKIQFIAPSESSSKN